MYFPNSPSMLLILDLVLQAKKKAGRADLAALSVSILPVKMRVEVAIIPRSPLGHLHNFLTTIDESIKLPVLIKEADTLLKAHPNGNSVGLVLNR